MNRPYTDHAETIAATALGWLAQTDDLLDVFLGSTGSTPDELRGHAGDPHVLAAVLDFVMASDEWILACAAHAGVRPEELTAARQHLPGGDLPHWT